MKKLARIIPFMFVTISAYGENNQYVMQYENKEVTKIEKHEYLESAYPQGAVLTPEASLTRDTPENVMAYMQSNINSLNFESWLNAWDEETKKLFESSGFISKKETVLISWKETTSNKTVFLLRKAVAPSFNAIEYGFMLNGKLSKSQLVFVMDENGKWFASNKYRDNPTVSAWRSDDKTDRNFIKK